MGCHTYTVVAPQNWTSDQTEEEMCREVYLTFPENDPVSCLCTFPHNYEERPESVPIYSLALLGAAVVLAHQNRLESDKTNLIPGALPAWIVEGIRAKLPPAELPEG